MHMASGEADGSKARAFSWARMSPFAQRETLPATWG